MHKVSVFQFYEKPSYNFGRRISPLRGTREAISKYNGEVIEDSAEEVDDELLDENKEFLKSWEGDA